MNEYQRALMGRPDLGEPGTCAICGRAGAEAHHIVPRSAGGTDGPVAHLCGRGSNLGTREADGSVRLFHHGMAHHHMLHFRYEGDHWEYLVTDEPTKYQTALDMEGWQELREHGDEYEYELSYDEPYLHHRSKKPVYFVGRDTTELPF